MKTVTIHGRKTQVSEPELRGLRTLKTSGFVALTSDFYERRSSGYGTCLLPGGNPSVYGKDRWDLLGMQRWKRGGNIFDKDATETWIGYPQKIIRFFKQHPRARFAIGGNPRRINAILRQVPASNDGWTFDTDTH